MLSQGDIETYRPPPPALWQPLPTPTIVQPIETSPAASGPPEGPTPKQKPPRATIDYSEVVNTVAIEDEAMGLLSPVAEAFFHSGWRANRAKIAAAMAEAGLPKARRFNFENCGAKPLVMVDRKHDQIRIMANHCHDRFCQICGKARQLRIAAALKPRITGHRTAFVVLTPRSNDRPLREQITAIYRSAAKLRQTKWWKARVSGGFQCFEITWNPKTRQWHPHLHLLVHFDWLPQDELSHQWSLVADGATVVHVSLVKQDEKAIRECTKYIGKIVHRTVYAEPDLIPVLMQAMKGRRLVTTFGSWRLDPLIKDEPPDPTAVWTVIGTLEYVSAKAAAGDRQSRDLLTRLSQRLRGVTTPTPAPVDDSS